MTTPNPTRTTDIDGQDKVLTALTALGQATARQIADHAGLGYSTVTERLRKLAEAGTVHKQPAGTGPTSWRPAGPAAEPNNQPEPEGQPVTPPEQPEPDQAEPVVNGGDEAEPDQATQDVTEATEVEPGTGRDPAPAAPPPAVDPTGEHATSDTTHQEPTTAPARPDAKPASATPGTRRRPGKRRPTGKLREEVLGVLRDHAEETLTPHQISKLLNGASSGAIVLACRKLVSERSATLVRERPATFQAE